MNKNKLLLWSVVAALAGFIFGFDTVVISGANSAHQGTLAHHAAVSWLFIMSMALWGTVIGAIFGGHTNRKFGRKSVALDGHFVLAFLRWAQPFHPIHTSFLFFVLLAASASAFLLLQHPTYISEILLPKQEAASWHVPVQYCVWHSSSPFSPIICLKVLMAPTTGAGCSV